MQRKKNTTWINALDLKVSEKMINNRMLGVRLYIVFLKTNMTVTCPSVHIQGKASLWTCGILLYVVYSGA